MKAAGAALLERSIDERRLARAKSRAALRVSHAADDADSQRHRASAS